jgi:hypothetical protein
MTEQDTGLHHAVPPGVTRDETHNTFEEAQIATVLIVGFAFAFLG